MNDAISQVRPVPQSSLLSPVKRSAERWGRDGARPDAEARPGQSFEEELERQGATGTAERSEDAPDSRSRPVSLIPFDDEPGSLLDVVG